MIVVDGRVLGGESTGIQRVACGLLDGMREVGAEVRVVAPRGVVDPRVDRTVPAVTARLWEQAVLPVLAGRRAVLSLANTAPLAAHRSAVLVHDLAPLREPAWFAHRMRAYAWAVATAARRAELVLTPSSAVAAELAEQLGVRDAVVVRPAVVGTPAPAAAVEAVRRRHRLARRYVLLVGWGDPRKDLETALAAHRLVRDAEPHDLVLVGRAHRNLAPVRPPDDPSVRVLGRLDEPELAAVLTGAEVLLHPSRYEGFGLPPLEAWAHGTPALVGNAPAVVEATEGRAPVLPLGDVPAWAEALEQALRTPLPVPVPPQWTWSDAGRRLQGALRERGLET